MDRRSLLLIAALAGCAGARGPHLRFGRVLSAGTLAYHVAYDAASRRLVAVELTTEFELVVRALTASGPRLVARIRLGPHEYDVNDLALEAGGRRAFIAVADGSVRAIELASGKTTARWRLENAATAVAVAPDGKAIATGSAGGILCLRRPDGALLQCVAAHDGPITTLEFAGGALLSGSADRAIARWRLPALAADGRQLAPGPIAALTAIGDGPAQTIAIGCGQGAEGHLGLWNRDRAPSWQPGPAVTELAFARGGSALLSAHITGEVVLWQIDRRLGATPELHKEHTLVGFTHMVRGLAAWGDRWFWVAAWGTRRGPSVALIELVYPPQTSASI